MIPGRAFTALAALGALSAATAAAGVPAQPPSSARYFAQQWALSNTGAQAIIQRPDALHSFRQAGTPGSDIGWVAAQALIKFSQSPPSKITVAVIDSGVDLAHPDLQGRIAPGGRDFLAGSDQMTDDLGHGTHVAGIIVAGRVAAGAPGPAGIAGVAPASVRVLPLRVLSRGFNTFAYQGKLIADYVADAITYAVAHQARVINLSLGWPRLADTPGARKAVAQALQAGVLIVASAGNDRKEEPTYPCGYEGVLCVGAVSNDGKPTAFSNRGGKVDLLAPGDGILSTYPTQLESQTARLPGYEILSGTSQAAPHVAAIAATLLSLHPGMTLDELRARLLVSGGSAEAEGGGALYPLVNLAGALTAAPQPVPLPDYKVNTEVVVDETSLTAQGTLSLKSLWQPMTGVNAEVTVNGRPAGAVSSPELRPGSLLSVPWKYVFGSLEDSSELQLILRVTDSSGRARAFPLELAAVRAAGGVTRRPAIPLGAGASPSWLGNLNGLAYSQLSPVEAYGNPPGLPAYYHAAGATIQLVDPAAPTPVSTLVIPGVDRIRQVLRIGLSGDGASDWVVIGTGTGTGTGTGAGSYLQFYFLDPTLRPLWGAISSVWRLPLDPVLGSNVLRSYSAPGSWIRAPQGSPFPLLPSFLASGRLPLADDFSELSSQYGRIDTHLYYLSPNPEPASPAAAPGALWLSAHALDNARMRSSLKTSLHLVNEIEASAKDLAEGHLRVLGTLGDGVDARPQLWDLTGIDSAQGHDAGAEWDALSIAGRPIQAGPGDSSGILTLYDSTRGRISWSSAEGDFLGRSEFTFTDLDNPISGFVGAFSLHTFAATATHVWFVQSAFDLIAFVESAPGQVETHAIPINRDSSFSEQQFNLLFAPLLVGTQSEPEPGVYIDTTQVQGHHVAVAAWDPQAREFRQPLRYSLAIPDTCAQMSPVHVTTAPGSFALPMLCRSSSDVSAAPLELRVLEP